MATKKELVKVAEELNEVLGLEPAISTGAKISVDSIRDKISQALGLLTPEDELEEDVAAILDAEFPGWDGDGTEDPEPEEEVEDEETSESEEAPAEEAPEEDEEEVEEAVEEKPATKTKPTKPEPQKRFQVAAGSKKGGTRRVSELVCENFEISNKEIAEALTEEGYKVSENTIYLQAADTRKVIAYLTEIGKIGKK